MKFANVLYHACVTCSNKLVKYVSIFRVLFGHTQSVVSTNCLQLIGDIQLMFVMCYNPVGFDVVWIVYNISVNRIMICVQMNLI